MFGGLARERERLVRAWRTLGCAPMHVEVAFDLSAFLREEHWKEKPRPKDLSQSGQQARSRARTELAGITAMLPKQTAPDLHVPIFDLRQLAVEVLFLRVRLGRGQKAIQIRCISFVLPMVREGIQIGLSGSSRGRTGGHERKLTKLRMSGADESYGSARRRASGE